MGIRRSLQVPSNIFACVLGIRESNTSRRIQIYNVGNLKSINIMDKHGYYKDINLLYFNSLYLTNVAILICRVTFLAKPTFDQL